MVDQELTAKKAKLIFQKHVLMFPCHIKMQALSLEGTAF